MVRIRAALTFGKLPTFSLLAAENKLPKKVRHTINQKLMEAYQILKDETCPNCGTVAWLGRTTNEWIVYKMDETTCWSCQHQEVDRDKQKKSKPGVHRYVVPTMADKTMDLPGRDDYYERIYKAHTAQKLRETTNGG